LPEGFPFEKLTEEPQRYGLHSTVVAPFFPRDTNEENLLRAAARFCRSVSPVTIPQVQVVEHRSFMALRPVEGGRHGEHACERLQALAADAVRFFFPLRTPPDSAEIARRLGENLSPKQTANVLKWGYPYVFDEYDFHITLTGPVRDAPAQALKPILSRYFREVTAEPLGIDHLCLCRQPVSGARAVGEKHVEFFTALECFPLTGTCGKKCTL
jgi:hypothetical protein